MEGGDGLGKAVFLFRREGAGMFDLEQDFISIRGYQSLMQREKNWLMDRHVALSSYTTEG
jgi:hypothetical protein